MKLTFTSEAFAKGEEVDLPGYGLIKNGEPFEVTDEQAERYEQMMGRPIEEALKPPKGEKETTEKPKGGKD